MAIAQAAFGVLLLSIGVAVIVARDRLGARWSRRSKAAAAMPVVWLFLATMMLVNGVLLLVLALA